MTWKPKLKTFQIIARYIPNNIKIKVYMLFICQSWNLLLLFLFWFRCYKHWAMWFPCYMNDINKDMSITLFQYAQQQRVKTNLWVTVKWTCLCLSRKKLQKYWIKIWLHVSCWCVNLHIFTFAQNHGSIFVISFEG